MEKDINFQEQKNRLSNAVLAYELIADLQGYGVIIRKKDMPMLVRIMTSAEILNYDLGKLDRLLGLSRASKSLVAKISANNNFETKFEKLLKYQLNDTGYKQVLMPNKLKFSEVYSGHKFRKASKNLNDPEITTQGIDKIKKIISEILNDSECQLKPGFFWNVFISKKIPYILKTERAQRQGKKEYQLSSLFDYAVIRDTIGKKFMLRQVILESQGGERHYVIQEKLDLKKAIMICAENINELMASGKGAKIRAILKKTQNKKELAEFVNGVEQLINDKRLMPDFLGHNLFFNIAGGLKIKLIDYGTSNIDHRDGKTYIDQNYRFIKKLKKLIY